MVEQVTFAALDTKSLDYACMLVAQIKKQFPGTQRAERLTVRLLLLWLVMISTQVLRCCRMMCRRGGALPKSRYLFHAVCLFNYYMPYSYPLTLVVSYVYLNDYGSYKTTDPLWQGQFSILLKNLPTTEGACMQAAYFEAKQMWEHEEKVLEKLTEDHPDSQAAMRRMVEPKPCKFPVLYAAP